MSLYVERLLVIIDVKIKRLNANLCAKEIPAASRGSQYMRSQLSCGTFQKITRRKGISPYNECKCALWFN